MEVERQGLKVALVRNPESISEELEQAFETEPAFGTVFFALGLGRQREYLLYIAQANKPATRLHRIAKNKARIL
jgi:uncharacterized protein YdeI (YjbR/CyaY-like superfamily)